MNAADAKAKLSGKIAATSTYELLNAIALIDLDNGPTREEFTVRRFILVELETREPAKLATWYEIECDTYAEEHSALIGLLN